jgi:hypothetical protein
MRTRQVLGWKVTPKAWWPVLPGRITPLEWNPAWAHTYRDAKHLWEPQPKSKKESK